LAPDENDVLYTPESFMRFKGITPYQYSQSMIISGCSTDKIPGIDKIGEGKAIAIMKEIGDLRNLNRATKIPGIGEEKLNEIKNSKEKMMFTKSLTTLYRDFEFKVDKGNRDLPLVKAYFNEYLKFYNFILDWENFEEIC
jgi:DNA polymerase-1